MNGRTAGIIDMHIVEQAKAILYQNEGYRDKPYLCTAGKMTIGIGRNLEDRGLSRSEADYLLHNDIDDVLKKLDKGIVWFVEAPENVQVVLIDMCFNMGWGGLSKFKNMLAAMAAGDMAEAARELLDSKYARDLPNRSKRNADMLVGV